MTPQATKPTTESSAPKAATSPVRSVLARIGVQNVSLLIALIVLVAAIGVQDPNFFRYQNLLSIGTAITVFGLLAVVQTLVILLGALDISVGSVTGLTSVVGAMVFTATSSSALGILTALIIGLLCGLVNGLIIVYGRVNPVIATLATLAAFKGLAQIISGGRSQGYTGSDAVYTTLGRGTLLGIPVLIYIFVAIALVVALVLKYSDIGRNIYAIGGNNTAARLAGINLNRYIIGVYIVVGLVGGLAGVLLTARTGSGQPISGSEGLELEAITAAALGGAALQGGKGTITGTVLAVILLGVLSNGLTVLGVNPFWQNVAKGALLVIAVVIQQRRSGQRAVGLPHLIKPLYLENTMAGHTDGQIRLEKNGFVAHLVLDRPEKLNAMTVAMDHRMNDLVYEINNDKSIRCVLLSGAGDRAFSAGSDITDLDEYGDNWSYRNRFDSRGDYARAIWLIRKPVVAAINGYCIGGGLEMASASDIRIATPQASFGAGEIRWGWHGGSGQTQFLTHLIGPGWASRLLLTGERIDGEEALRIGLVQHVVPFEELIDASMAIAQSIAEKSPIAIEKTKHMVRVAQNVPLESGLLVENDSFSYLMMTEDAAEGRAAFAEKRAPQFKGR